MTSRADARRALERLIERLRGQAYSSHISELNIRGNLIEPLFRDVLGWNTEAIAEYDREHYSRGAGIADAVCVTDGQPLLYIEAKRLGAIAPLAELRRNAKFYTEAEEQALRYARRSTGMLAGKRWTVLTNFERLRVYEATSEERVLAFESPEELLEKFDELMLLSKPELTAGALDHFVARQRKPDIDAEFRDVLSVWRRTLAQDLYDRNVGRSDRPDLSNLREIQSAVQRLLDRLIIIQFAADVDALAGRDPLRELLALTAEEPPMSLIERPSLREMLFTAFRRFDEFYNTTLFAAGHILESFKIGDKALRTVIDSVAGQSFRRLDADILGTTYEDYLAHELIVRDGRVDLDLKPEIRKAGGIYYTPAHVVHAVVDRALRPLVESAETPEEVDRITVLDPACGSGSFLIRAFSVFADWYDAENARRRGQLAHGARDQVSLDEMTDGPIRNYGRRILERNLYGVDLDPVAAELATVNLIMQALRRGRDGLELERLPLVLGQNIKVGNSVVPGWGSAAEAYAAPLADRGDVLRTLRDLRLGVSEDPNAEAALLEFSRETVESMRTELDAELGGVIDEPPQRSPFYWQLEFPEVFDPDLTPDQRGFGVILGNPPWIGFHGAGQDRRYLERHYASASGRFDVYVPFVELGVSVLRQGGRLGMITPSNFFLRDYGDRLRSFLKRETSIEQVVDFADDQIFAGATNYPAILVLRKEGPTPEHEITYLRKTYDPESGRRHHQAELSDDGWVFLTSDEGRLFEHLESVADTTLGEVCRVGNDSRLSKGIITGQNKVFLLDAASAHELKLEADLLRPAAKGQDVGRWTIPPPPRLLIYPYVDGRALTEGELAERPNIYRWLLSRKDIPQSDGGLAGRDYFDGSDKHWYELWNERSSQLMDVPKIVSPEVNDRPEFALVDANVAFTDSATGATPTAESGVCREFLAGLLNTRLLALYHARHSVPKANGYLIYSPAFLKGLPLKLASTAEERAIHDQIADRVRELCQASAARRAMVTDFRRYVADFAIEDRTLGGLLGAELVGRRDALCRETGTLRDVTAVRDDDGSILVLGRVRFAGVDYEPGEFTTTPLLRVRLPEPTATFLLRWLATRPHIAATRTRSVPTLSFKAQQVLLPSMTDDERAIVVEQYERELAKADTLDRQMASLEREVEEAVADLYGLTPDMKATVRNSQLPAETLKVGSDTVVERPSDRTLVLRESARTG